MAVVFNSLTRRCRQTTLVKLQRQMSNNVANPLINAHPAYVMPAVLPFGFDFVDPRLADALKKKKVDVDNVEFLYNQQKQNDHEFNSPALPQRDSLLWGYVYGEQLAQAKVRFDTLGSEESFLANYLKAQIGELKMRMRRYYPQLDWESRYNAEMEEIANGIDEGMEDAYADSVAEVISRSPSDYVNQLRNNWFIAEYDTDDKFNDYVPRALDEKLVNRFQFDWDRHSVNADATKYVPFMQSFEKSVATRLEAVAKNVRHNTTEFLKNSCARSDLSFVDQLVDAVEDATDAVVSDVSGLNNTQLAEDLLDKLGFKSGKLSADNAQMLAQLCFGNGAASKQLVNKDTSALVEIVAGVDSQRLQSVHKAVQIQKYYSLNGFSRLLTAVLFRQCPNFFGQMCTDKEAHESFFSQHDETFNAIVSTQTKLWAAQSSAASSLAKLETALVKAVSARVDKSEKDELSGHVAGAVANVAQLVDSNDLSWVIAAFEEAAEASRESQDIFGEIRNLTMASYLRHNGANVYWYQLLNDVCSPPRGGLDGSSFAAFVSAVANNSSEASDALFEPLAQQLKALGAVSASESSSFKSNLSTQVAKEWDALRSSAVDCDKLRQECNQLFQSVQFNFETGFDFEQIRQTYNPLDIHLAQYRYLSPQ